MTGSDADRWCALCAKAAVEQDPSKLADLLREINWFLEVEQQRLRGLRGTSPAPARDWDFRG